MSTLALVYGDDDRAEIFSVRSYAERVGERGPVTSIFAGSHDRCNAEAYRLRTKHNIRCFVALGANLDVASWYANLEDKRCPWAHATADERIRWMFDSFEEDFLIDFSL